MFFSLIIIVVKTTLDVGGFSIVVDRNIESGRLESPEYLTSLLHLISLSSK